MASSDVLIIGGGINGVCAAYHLSRRGVAVTLLEKGAIASGPTGRSCGIVRQHYSHPITARMALRALRVFQRFDEIVGGECDFRASGFMVAAKPDNVDTLRANVAMQQSVGIDTRVLSVEEMREIWPAASEEGIGAVAYEPESGYADAHATTTSYAQRAAELGANLRTGVTVTAIRMEGSRVTGVETDKGFIPGGAVLLAAGPWAPQLARGCGLELPITPSRVQVCLFEPPQGVTAPTVLGDSHNGIYIRPETGSLVLAGSLETREGEGDVSDPDRYDQSVDMGRIEHYSERLVRRLPAMRDGTYHNGWASLYDVTPDWQPIIDAARGIEGLFVLAGCSGHGFKLAPVVGEMAAEMILEGPEHDPDLAMFALDRFDRAELHTGSYEDHRILA